MSDERRQGGLIGPAEKLGEPRLLEGQARRRPQGRAKAAALQRRKAREGEAQPRQRVVQKAVGATGLQINQAPISLAFRFKGLPSPLKSGERVGLINVLRNLQGGPENPEVEGQARFQHGGRPQLHLRSQGIAMGAVNLIKGFHPGAPGHDLAAQERVDQGRFSRLDRAQHKGAVHRCLPIGPARRGQHFPILGPLPQKIREGLGPACCSLFHGPAIPAKTLC